jgi:hypothetical protein
MCGELTVGAEHTVGKIWRWIGRRMYVIWGQWGDYHCDSLTNAIKENCWNVKSDFTWINFQSQSRQNGLGKSWAKLLMDHFCGPCFPRSLGGFRVLVINTNQRDPWLVGVNTLVFRIDSFHVRAKVKDGMSRSVCCADLKLILRLYVGNNKWKLSHTLLIACVLKVGGLWSLNSGPCAC